eukprot:CAMPEP_0115040776 /NCGR_PEP_ID=MMETSP0216-20121206/45048_1 /TAXON_ID=223996 /ORGANISM="Protocruzia adherens, Strain Boccale" /LENGTH=60 /DNA_ID=CAMNT_0002422117 /DNA_START=1 /DNA_END=180 /DNA_ORIENTATION=-
MWDSIGQDGDGSGKYARIVTPTATPSLGTEFGLNSKAAGDQKGGDLVVLPNKNVFAVWES